METATLPGAPLSSAALAASSSASCALSPSTQQSSSEHDFLCDGIACDVRSDGRSRVDYRYFQLRPAVVGHCAGSARMQLAGTDVLVAVTADITPTDWSRPDDGILLCSVELSASLAASASAASSLLLSTELQAALEALYIRSRSFDTRQLCLLRGEQCWTLHIDVLVLSADGGVVDVASLATKAALVASRLPAVAVSRAADQQRTEVTLLSDQPPTRLQATDRLPVAVTLHAFNRSAHFVLDAAADEEAAAEWRLRVGVCEDGQVVNVEKGGRRAATQPLLTQMMQQAMKVGADLNRLVRTACAAHADC